MEVIEGLFLSIIRMIEYLKQFNNISGMNSIINKNCHFDKIADKSHFIIIKLFFGLHFEYSFNILKK